jgi:phosphate:Na+ symporter
VVLFHLAFNTVVGAGLHRPDRHGGALVQRLLPTKPGAHGRRPRSTWTRSALATPSLAISCAAREALHQADVVETDAAGMHQVIRTTTSSWPRTCANSMTRWTSCTRPSSTT